MCKKGSSVRLRPLFAVYSEKEHKMYVDALEDALNHNGVKNIALAGGYGVGKSSILQGFVKNHEEEVAEISLSTLSFDRSAASTQSSIPSQEAIVNTESERSLSVTNLIQKEIVKQLLYRQQPSKMRQSRFERIEIFKFRTHWPLIALISFLITLSLRVFGWQQKVFIAIGLTGLSPTYSFLMSLSCVFLMVWFAGLQLNGRLKIRKLSIASATITLSPNSMSFFDEYLDEIVYFFESTKTRITIFEDIDRFDDPYIFETLRSLNTLLNGTKYNKRKDSPIVFIYAIKDSIFDYSNYAPKNYTVFESELSSKNATGADFVTEKLKCANRTKFFDLIIPVVPFVTHFTARDFMIKEIKRANIDLSNSLEALVTLAARHFTDMRMIRNVCNEYQVFFRKIFPINRESVNLRHESLFALMLYKNAHPLDFERIQLQSSDLDKIYQISRRIITQNIQSLDREITDLKKEGMNRSIDDILFKIGNSLIKYVDTSIRHVEKVSDDYTVKLGERSFPRDLLTSVDFWTSYFNDTDDLEVVCTTYNSSFIGPHGSILIERRELDDLIPYKSLEEVSALTEEHTQNRIAILCESRKFLLRATMSDLIKETQWTIQSKTADNGLSLSECSKHYFNSPLMRDLLEHGYIDQNFTLYTAPYDSELLSTNGLNFVIHHLSTNIMDLYYELSEEEIGRIVQDHLTQLSESGMYNICIFNYLFENSIGIESFVKYLNRAGSYGPDQRALLTEYFKNGNFQVKLLESLKDWSALLKVLIEDLKLDEAVRSDLVSTLLSTIEEGSYYVVDSSGIKEYFQGHADSLSVFKQPMEETQAKLVVSILKQANVKFENITRMNKSLRTQLLLEDCYQINDVNLLAASGESRKLGLDTFYKTSPMILPYLITNIDSYIDVLSTRQGFSAFDGDTESLVSVLNGDLDGKVDSVEKLLEQTRTTWFIDLTGLHPLTWPFLMKSGHVRLTFQNVSRYIEKFGIDESLAEQLIQQRNITEIDESVEDSYFQEFALRILNASVQLPVPEVRVDLVNSLKLESQLPASSIVPESGNLFGLLIGADLIEDSYDTYNQISTKGWETCEFYLLKSKNYTSYLEIIWNKIALKNVLESRVLSNNFKAALIDLYNSNLRSPDEDVLNLFILVSEQLNCTLSYDYLFHLRNNRALEEHQTLRLLSLCLDETQEYAQVEAVLRVLGGDYEQLLKPGWNILRFDSCEYMIKILAFLKRHGHVSSFNADNGRIKVNMKHK